MSSPGTESKNFIEPKYICMRGKIDNIFGITFDK
jgi:hypothetical protein